MLRLTTIITIAITVLFLRPAQAEDWGQFRGPNAQGISQDKNIPVKWSAETNLQWKLALPGGGFSSPIVVGDKVIVTCYSAAGDDLSKLKRHLLCITRSDGKIAWKKTIPSTATERQPPGFAPRHGFASHTPVSDGKAIYVLFGNTGVIAFDMKGKEMWRKSVGTSSASMFGSAASPILYKKQLIVPAYSEGEVIKSFDKTSGKQLWKAEGDLGRSYVTPIIARNKQGTDELVIGIPYEVWSLNPTTGKLKWYAETQVDTNACPTIVVNGNIVYTIGGRSGGRAAIKLGGKGDVTKKNVVWSSNGGAYVSSPVVYKGHLYWFHERGILNCVDIKTGKLVKRQRLRGQFYASAVLINGNLFGVSRFGGTYVVKATPELKQLALNKLGDSSDFSGTPAVSDGQLFLRSDKFLYCIRAKK